MKLTTKVDIPIPDFRLNFTEQGLILGSCFAQNIGTRFRESRMRVVSNPYGVIYNPLSIARALSAGALLDSDLVPHQGLWHSMLHHGSFSGTSPQQTLSQVNAYKHNEHQYQYVIVTLGTTWIYRYRGQVVANCHKLPDAEFTRECATLTQTIESLLQIMELCPQAKFIFTVSPIRHLKDGLVENSLSKATLRLAIDEIVRHEPRASYFPAYEIMVDELRDYRFYNSDMTHPSPLAIDYILDNFCDSYLDQPSAQLMQRALKFAQARSHRPLHPESEEFQKFTESMRRTHEKLSVDYPQINWEL